MCSDAVGEDGSRYKDGICRQSTTAADDGGGGANDDAGACRTSNSI